MPIVSVSIKNFKSYQTATIDFHQHLNIILGHNGHGKSNLFKTFLFVFSNKNALSKLEFQNISHRGISLESSSEVEVVFKVDTRNQNNKLLNQDIIDIGRRWTLDGKDQLLIQGKVVDKKYFINIVESFGLSYNDPFNIVQQGKISQLVLMNDHDLYKVLQQSMGLRRYWKNKEQAGENYTKVETIKSNLEQTIRILKIKFNALNKKKQQFEQLEKEDHYQKRKNYKNLSLALKGTIDDKQKALDLLSSSNQSVILQTRRKGQLTQKLEQIQNNIRTLNNKLAIYQPTQSKKKINNPQTDIPKLQKQLKANIKEKKAIERQISDIKQKYSDQKKIHQEIKKKLDDMQIDKQILNSKQREEMINNSIKEYNNQIKSFEQTIQKYSKLLKDLDKNISNKNGISQEDYEELKAKKQKLDQAKYQYEQRIKNIKMQKINYNKRRNNIQIERQSLRFLIIKQEGKVNFKTKDVLHNKLMTELQMMKISGIYGYIADHISIVKDLSFAYDIAAKNRFFSILVEDQNVAKSVMNANKRIKGSKINIFILSHFKKDVNKKIKYPQNKYTYPLINKNWLKIVKNQNYKTPADFEYSLNTLIQELIGKFVLVQTYSQALQISKEHNLNCITGKGQIVNAGAVFSKVGQMDISKPSRLLAYQKIIKYRTKLQEYNEQNQNILKGMDSLDNKISSIMRQNHKVQSQHKSFAIKFQQASLAYKSLCQNKKQESRLLQSIQSMKKQIQNKKQLKQRLIQKKTGNVSKISTQQISKFQEQFKSQNKTVNRMLQQLFDKQQALSKLNQLINQDEQKISKTKQEEQQSRLQQSVSVKDQDIINLLQNEIEQQTKQMLNIHNEIMNINQQIMKCQAQVLKYQQRLNTVQSKQKITLEQMDIIAKIVDVKLVTKEDPIIQERIKKNANKINSFTKQDRILFNTFTDFSQTFQGIIEELDELGDFDQKFKQFVTISDRQIQQQMEEVITRFIKIFKQIIQRIDNTITCNVNIKKYYKKDTLQYKRGFDIRVAFNSDKDAKIQRKMTQLSGGQKTVVAVAFLISLQMCNNCSYYVFDEVDAALDPNYSQRISKLLVQLSGDTQYFVSTFKPTILNEADPNCSYYQVFNNARVSRIKNVGFQKAISIINSNLMKNIIEDRDQNQNDSNLNN